MPMLSRSHDASLSSCPQNVNGQFREIDHHENEFYNSIHFPPAKTLSWIFPLLPKCETVSRQIFEKLISKFARFSGNNLYSWRCIVQKPLCSVAHTFCTGLGKYEGPSLEHKGQNLPGPGAESSLKPLLKPERNWSLSCVLYASIYFSDNAIMIQQCLQVAKKVFFSFFPEQTFFCSNLFPFCIQWHKWENEDVSFFGGRQFLFFFPIVVTATLPFEYVNEPRFRRLITKYGPRKKRRTSLWGEKYQVHV